jgi:succinoglycan biosynthesis transport protein ExoP
VKAMEMIQREWPVATEIRKLESRLWRNAQKEGRKIILVTSPLQGEGKSTSVALLGTAAALHRRSPVLIVDLDFRHPSLHGFFEKPVNDALPRYLRGDAGLEEVVSPSGVEHLDLILAAPDAYPAELVNSSRLGTMLDGLRTRYDLILLDAPAVVPVADTAAIVPYADGVLLTVMAGRSSKHHLMRCRDLLLGMDAEIVGLVVGNIQEAAPSYMDAAYHHYAATGDAAGS